VPAVDNQPPQAESLVRLRRNGQEMQMDMTALITLVQQGALGADTEANSSGLTGGEWKRLTELELYRTFHPDVAVADATRTTSQSRWFVGRRADRRGDRLKPMGSLPAAPMQVSAKAGAPADLSEAYEQNLRNYFESFAVIRLNLDGWIALVSAGLAALLSAAAHRSVLTLLMSGAAGVVAYLFVDRTQFPAWIRGVRFSGFRRFPWNSRVFHVASVAVPGCFLIASFLPLLPSEGLFRFIDSFACIVYTSAAATIWAFRISTQRMKRAFILSSDSGPAEAERKET
jgi:hypothetical protein